MPWPPSIWRLRLTLGLAVGFELLLWTTALHASASAQAHADLPTAVLFSTAGAPSGGDALDAVVHHALQELHVVDIVARPGMDLGAAQLALDCVAESAACLGSVAKQTGAQILIAPSVEVASDELLVSVLRFDIDTGQMRRALHRQPGKVIEADTLDAVPGMLRELFDLPNPTAAPPSQPVSAPISVEGPMEPPHDAHEIPIGALILGGAGVLVIGGGVISGALALGSQSDYNRIAIHSTSDADAALRARSRAQTEATLANVLFGVGGAALVAGGIWLAVALHGHAHESDALTWVVPSIAPTQLGLSIIHRGGTL